MPDLQPRGGEKVSSSSKGGRLFFVLSTTIRPDDELLHDPLSIDPVRMRELLDRGCRKTKAVVRLKNQ